MTLNILKSLILIGLLASISAAGSVEFLGTPARKIVIDVKGEEASDVSKEDQGKYQAVITKEGDNYFWTSRGGVPLVKTESGSFETFVAVNGSGYIRTMSPTLRELYSKLNDSQKHEAGFIYMEHLIHLMGSITYYGF